jgi:gliding motility-associated-like protein
MKNGADTGIDSMVYILDTPVSNDQVTCEVTSSEVCASPAVVTSNTIDITVFDSVMVSIFTQDPVCAGSPNLLDAGSGYNSYLWSDGATGPSITVEDEGIYWVMVTDANGCAGADSVMVGPCEPIPQLFAPNAFTPDFDGYNDRFFLVCSSPGSLTYFEVSIYNRWGQLIFTSEDIGEGWDGTIDGKPCQSDVYTYIATCTYSAEGGGSRQVAGTVALIR